MPGRKEQRKASAGVPATRAKSAGPAALSGGGEWKLREDGKRSSTFFEMLAGRLELTIWIAASTSKKPSLARGAVVSPKDSIMEA
jgi:hypothetical protein